MQLYPISPFSQCVKMSSFCAHREAEKKHWLEETHNKNVDGMAQQFIYITDIGSLIFVGAQENYSG